MFRVGGKVIWRTTVWYIREEKIAEEIDGARPDDDDVLKTNGRSKRKIGHYNIISGMGLRGGGGGTKNSFSETTTNTRAARARVSVLCFNRTSRKVQFV